MTKTKLKNKPWWYVNMTLKGRNSSIELAKFGLACLVFFTHIMAFTSMQKDHAILARTFRQLGAMATLTFAGISGYYLIGKPSKGRWLKTLFTMLILLLANWLVEVIGLAIRDEVWLGSSSRHKVTWDQFWAHPMHREGWLSQMLVGNDIHWYMWQFAIALTIFPIISVGLVKLSKRSYLGFTGGLLLLNVVMKVVILANFEENTLGGFMGFYGRSNSMLGGDGAPYSGYNWILLLLMMMFAGYLKLHYDVKNHKLSFVLVIAVVWSLIIAIIWHYSNHDISSYSSARSNGYDGELAKNTNYGISQSSVKDYNAWLENNPNKTISEYLTTNPAATLDDAKSANFLEGYNAWAPKPIEDKTFINYNSSWDETINHMKEFDAWHTGDNASKTMTEFMKDNNFNSYTDTFLSGKYDAASPIETNIFITDNQPVITYDVYTNDAKSFIDYKDWYAKQYVVTDAYGITWIGTFLEGGNYIPVAAIIGSLLMLFGIIHLPEKNIKVGRFLGSISYAFYFMHMDAMSWTSYLFSEGFGVPWDGKNFYDSSSYGFLYIAFMVISWVIAIPYAVGGIYLVRLGMKHTQGFWDKYFNENEKTKEVLAKTK